MTKKYYNIKKAKHLTTSCKKIIKVHNMLIIVAINEIL